MIALSLREVSLVEVRFSREDTFPGDTEEERPPPDVTPYDIVITDPIGFR